MNRSLTLRRLLLAPPTLRTLVPNQPHLHLPSISLPRPYSTSPSIVSRSFWVSMIPKPFRRSSASNNVSPKPAKSKDWNPATFYIVIFMLIGSMSIQMIALKNGFAAFTRRADAKVGLLKEVIGRVQKGEEVDVEGLLGTGDARREREWEEVLREIEEEDQAWENSRKSKPKHGKNLEESKIVEQRDEKPMEKVEKEKPTTSAPVGFY